MIDSKISHTNQPSPVYRRMVLLLLTMIYALNFIDRQIIGILSPFIQADLGLSNSQMGLLKGLVFALFYTTIGIPIAWLADRYSRINIVSASVAVFSAFTALTGMASSFVSIGLARMGVGFGEAGSSPPSHSMISDLYPEDKRAGALGIFSLGIPIGLGFAYVLSGIVLGNPDNGSAWRDILIWLGVAGLALALLARLIIREPERGMQERADATILSTVPFKEGLAILLKIPSWWFMCFGITFTSFTAYAMSTWQMDYLLPFNSAQSSPKKFTHIMYILGTANCFIYGLGTYLGGQITQKLAQRSVRWYGWVPAITVATAIPLIMITFWAPSTTAHLFFSAITLFFLGMYLGPTFAIAQSLAPINMRAMSTALFFLILNLIALGGGPTAVGFLADYFKGQDYNQILSVRYAISLVTGSMILGVLSFYLASRALPEDLARAQARNMAQSNAQTRLS